MLAPLQVGLVRRNHRRYSTCLMPRRNGLYAFIDWLLPRRLGTLGVLSGPTLMPSSQVVGGAPESVPLSKLEVLQDRYRELLEDEYHPQLHQQQREQ